MARPKASPCSTSRKRSESAIKGGGEDAVYYGTKLRGSTNAEPKMTMNFVPRRQPMTGYELLNERPSERAQVLATLARSLHQSFGG